MFLDLSKQKLMLKVAKATSKSTKSNTTKLLSRNLIIICFHFISDFLIKRAQVLPSIHFKNNFENRVRKPSNLKMDYITEIII